MNQTIKSLYHKFLNSTGVCTDSRNIKEGNLFFALKGDKFNGNKFAAETLKKGATYAVIDEESYYNKSDDRYIFVEDSLNTLQQLATYHRRQSGIPILAISGSNGKTTTKELIHNVLGKSFYVFATPGNLNNHIGVPLSILQIDNRTEIAVLEMGGNHLYELEALCKIAEPSYGLLTNIGMDHLEGYGSFENVAIGNGELYYYLLDNEGEVFVNSEDELLMGMSSPFEKRYTYPAKNDYYHCQLLSDNFYINVQSEKGEIIQSKLIGEYNFYNIAAALCVGKFFKVPSSLAKKAIEEYEPKNNRSQILETHDNFLFLDAYNANPSSMMASIKSFLNMNKSKKWLILGDMHEMGTYSNQEHKKILDFLKDKDITQAVFIGKAFYEQKENNDASGFMFFESKTGFENYLKNNPLTNAAILIKGSRGEALETLKEYL